MSILALDLFVHSVLIFSNGEIVVVLLRVFVFPVIISFALISGFFSSVIFTAIVSIVVLSLLITIVCWVLFFFNIGETAFNEFLPSLRSTVVSFALRFCETSSHIALGSLLVQDTDKSGDVINRQSAVKFIPSNEILFVVGHVNRSEESIHEVLEVIVRAVLVVIRQLAVLVIVHKLNGFPIHANVVEECAHVTMSCLVEI